MRIKHLIFSFLISFLFLFFLPSTIYHLPSTFIVHAEDPFPPPYVPCNSTSDPEFHSLRPYQASPCNNKVVETASFCGNSLGLENTITVNKSAATSCDGSICYFEYAIKKSIAVDLSGAHLPIMGNTEDVLNYKEEKDTIDDPEKVNEYVSWYLNGVSWRAEQLYLDARYKDDRSKIVDYSGPLRKLLPQRIQDEARRKSIEEAGKSQHDEIVACTLVNIPVPCYPKGILAPLLNMAIQKHRLSDWKGHLPPREEDFATLHDYYKATQQWRGKFCFDETIPYINLKIFFCVDDPTDLIRPHFWSNLFPYVPFSSTEDTKSQTTISDSSSQNQSSDIEISGLTITNQKGSELYLSHMNEAIDLADLLQSTYVPKGNDKTKPTDSNSGYCDLAYVRTNQGDNLFAGEIGGDLSYYVKFSCDFSSGGDTCTKTFPVNLSVETKTPVIDDVYSRLVEGPSSVFKRMYPKVGEGGAISGIVDIPASSKVTSSDSSIKEIYFPHLGSVSEYFLKGIQTILRPKGYGEQLIAGSPVDPNSISVKCSPAIAGPCTVQDLLPYFGNDTIKATKASIICNAESGGRPDAQNKSCLTSGTDYSAGLFQINLLAWCPGAFQYSLAGKWCKIIDQSKVDACWVKWWNNVDGNIKKAVDLSRGGTNWDAWSTAEKCGIK